MRWLILSVLLLAHPARADVPGATVVARWSERPTPSVLGAEPRLERLEFSGPQSARAIVHAALRLRAIAREMGLPCD